MGKASARKVISVQEKKKKCVHAGKSFTSSAPGNIDSLASVSNSSAILTKWSPDSLTSYPYARDRTTAVVKLGFERGKPPTTISQVSQLGSGANALLDILRRLAGTAQDLLEERMRLGGLHRVVRHRCGGPEALVDDATFNAPLLRVTRDGQVEMCFHPITNERTKLSAAPRPQVLGSLTFR